MVEGGVEVAAEGSQHQPVDLHHLRDERATVGALASCSARSGQPEVGGQADEVEPVAARQGGAERDVGGEGRRRVGLLHVVLELGVVVGAPDGPDGAAVLVVLVEE
ncbi:MAG: hypothetical protein ABGZ36_11130, partial [Actinomycetota bacterium]